MQKKSYRFKNQFFKIGQVHNIPALVVCSGHGYSFRTYCCNHCGEIYITDEETLASNYGVPNIDKESVCAACDTPLKDSLVSYPENIFFNGVLLRNTEAIDRVHFEDTFLREVYVIK